MQNDDFFVEDEAQIVPNNEAKINNEPPAENNEAGDPIPETNENGREPFGYPYVQSRFLKPLPKGVTEETYDDYMSARKCGKILGISCLVIMGILTAYSLVYGFAAGFLNAFGIDIVKYLSDPAINSLLQIFFTIVMFTLPFVGAALINRYKISALVPLGKIKEGKGLPYFLFGLGFCAFAQVAVSQAATIFSNMGFEYNLPENENPEGVFGFLLSVIATAMVPALMEELGCRGIMFGIAEKKGGTVFALIVSSVLFGLIHRNFMQIPFAFLVGLILGIIRIKTGSLWVCIFVHGVNNLISVIVDYLGDYLSAETANIIFTVYIALCLISGFLGVALLSRNKSEGEYGLLEDESQAEITFASTVSQRLKWFFKSPWVLIAAIIFIGEACVYLWY